MEFKILVFYKWIKRSKIKIIELFEYEYNLVFVGFVFLIIYVFINKI